MRALLYRGMQQSSRSKEWRCLDVIMINILTKQSRRYASGKIVQNVLSWRALLLSFSHFFLAGWLAALTCSNTHIHKQTHTLSPYVLFGRRSRRRARTLDYVQQNTNLIYLRMQVRRLELKKILLFRLARVDAFLAGTFSFFQPKITCHSCATHLDTLFDSF